MTLHLLTVLTAAILLIHVPASLSYDDLQYLECNATFPCGKISGIRYPFWRDYGDRPCAYPRDDFKLACTLETAEITIGKVPYEILRMDKSLRRLTVARKDFPRDLCLGNIGNVSFKNTNYGRTSDTTNLALFYNCPDLPPTLPQTPQFNLSSSRLSCDNRTGYFVTMNNSEILASVGDKEAVDSIEAYLAECGRRVVVPLFGSAAASLKNGGATMDRVVAAIDKGFGVKWYANDYMCEPCVESGGLCGETTAYAGFTCYCKDKPHLETCPGTPSEAYRRAMVAIGIATGMIAIGIATICAFKGRSLIGKAKTMWKKDTNQKGCDNTEAFIRNYGYLSTKQYSYSYIKKMTNSFSDKLGQGGYGSVYKGTMEDGRLVAVKILKDSKNDNGEFINEVASISRTSHVNVVALLGFCYERNNKALLYEFMPNGSLDRFIYNNGSLNRLEWDILFQIACGIARGLEYLHRGCSTRIVHFDIKPHNILLDKDLVPKISDFGLAKLCTKDESVVSMTGARGTMGYISPEVFCRNFGGVSHKSDVYSYGMMVLEMVGGRKNICVGGSETNESFIPSRIYKQVESGETLNIEGVGTEEENEIARKMTLVSLWCIQTMPESRPSMKKVLEMLEASVESLQIPPKPTLMSPPRSQQHTWTISNQQQSSTMSSES